MSRIGYIGLGDIGAPIAARLIEAGFDVSLWARRSDALDRYVETPATLCSSAVDVARRSEVLGLCVLDDAAVLDVLDDEVIAALPEDAVVLVQSTVLPSTCREVARRASPRGVAVVDAPVSGGSDGAARGQLTMPVGGDRAAVHRCSAVLDALGRWRHTGDLGTGQVAKICNNLLYSAKLGVTLATLSAARSMGADPAVLRDILETASGGSFVLGRLPRLTQEATIDHSVALLEKDRDLFRTLCTEEGYDASTVLDIASTGLVEVRKWKGLDWTVPS